MNKFQITIILIFLNHNLLFSQQTRLFGKVTGADKLPATGVSVIIYRPGNQNPYKFAITDKNGFYSISNFVFNDSVLVRFKSLNYKDSAIVADKSFLQDNQLKLDIELAYSQKKLDPVIVTAVKPIIVKGDTTIFNAEKFGSESELKVEDVLKNLPGMSVDNDGNLKYKNKAISKVLIEGDDLFGNNYKILTQNLAANTLSQVEAIENNSENQVLKSFNSNKRTILNLKLKKQFLIRLFGETKLNGSTDNYDASANIFSLLNKFKFANILSLNNVGNDIKRTFSVPADIYESMGPNNAIEKPASLSNEFISQITIPLVDKNLSFINKDRGLSFNSIQKLTDKLEIKADGFGFKSDNYVQKYKQTTYLQSLVPFSIAETSSNQFLNQQINGNLSLVYANGEKTCVESKFAYSDKEETGSALLNTNNINYTQNSHQNNRRFLFSSIATQKIAPKTAIEIETLYLNQSNPQTFTNSPLNAAYTNFIGIDSNFTNLTYRINNPIDFFAVAGRLYNYKNINTNKLDLNLSVGLSTTHQTVPISTYSSDLFHNTLNLNDSFNIVNYYSTEKYWSAIKLSYFSGDWVFKLGPQVNLLRQRLQNKFITTQPDFTNKFFFDPNLNVRYNISTNRSIELSYSYVNTPFNTTDVYSGYQLLDYRTFNLSTINYETIKNSYNQQVSLLYNNVRMSSGQLLLINLSYNFGENMYQSKYDYYPSYAIQKLIQSPSNNNSLNTFILFEKAISAIKSQLSINTFLSSYSNYRIAGTVIYKQNGINYNQELNLRTAFDLPFNFKTGIRFMYNKQYSPLNTFNSFQYQVKTEINYLGLSKKLLIKLRNNIFVSSTADKSLDFISLYGEYKLIKNKLALNITGNNLLDNENISYIRLTGDQYSQEYTHLNKRIITIGINFRF